MAILHMDVDACRSTQSNMVSTKDQLANQATALLNAVNGTVGTNWIATGANTYQSDFQNWQASVNQLLEQLLTLSNRLNAEISEWEQVGNTFG
jgi:uncharacterized protein YukE